MEQEIAAFIRHLETERNASPHTLAAYRSDLAQFQEFVQGELGTSAGPEGVSHLLIRRWLALLHKDHTKSSVGRKLAAVRAFFKHLVRIGSLVKNPAELVSTPKKEKRVPYHLSIDEVTALVETPRETDLLSLRDRAILETLYSCGVRVSELTGLNVGGIDLDDGTVRVLGKGSKERIVPVGSHARTALSRYLAARNHPPSTPHSSPTPGAAGSPPAVSVAWWTSTSFGSPPCERFPPTFSGTPSPPTCWKGELTCGPSRNSWATPPSPRPRSTPTWASTDSWRSTTRPTPRPGNNPCHFINNPVWCLLTDQRSGGTCHQAHPEVPPPFASSLTNPPLLTATPHGAAAQTVGDDVSCQSILCCCRPPLGHQVALRLTRVLLPSFR